MSERVELKFDVLRQIAALEPGLIATNTSALSIDRLASVLPAPARFLGMHFFNPVWSFKLVELVRGAATSPRRLRGLGHRHGIGKEYIAVRDLPGFATSRLDFIASLEAMRMLEDGVVEPPRTSTAPLCSPTAIPSVRCGSATSSGWTCASTSPSARGRRYGSRYTTAARSCIDKVARGEFGQKSGHRDSSHWPEGSQ